MIILTFVTFLPLPFTNRQKFPDVIRVLIDVARPGVGKSLLYLQFPSYVYNELEEKCFSAQVFEQTSTHRSVADWPKYFLQCQVSQRRVCGYANFDLIKT